MLIVFEGVDKSGKTTIASKFLNHLIGVNPKKSVCTYEPTDALRTKLRVVDSKDNPLTEALWFTEDRREHVSEIVQPLLDSGFTVLMDRYYYSTVAYQSLQVDDITISNELADEIWNMNSEFPVPDVVFIVDRGPVRISDLDPTDRLENFQLLTRVKKFYDSLPQWVHARGGKIPLFFRIDNTSNNPYDAVNACIAAYNLARGVKEKRIKVGDGSLWNKEDDQ